MEIRLPYGHSYLTCNLPDHFQVDIIEPPHTPPGEDPLELVEAALNDLLGELDWSNFSGSKSVGIAINDKTRPVPLHHLLPPLLERLASLGIPDEAICFYVAVGTHPPLTKDEMARLLPENLARRYRVISHDAYDQHALTHLGKTLLYTPIWVNKEYFDSELKIVVGNIEPHQFVGFSGGAKGAAIGLAGIETINQNHIFMIHPDSQLGQINLNLVRQDIDEIGQKIGVHLAVNAILNSNRQIVEVLAGDPDAVMSAGVPLVRKIRQVAVDAEYDFTISSPGGHPKDINVYQSQKALAHAALITKLGGIVLLAAACPEGSGSTQYENWILGKKTNSEVLDTFASEGFKIGHHKAFQIARDATKCRLLTYTTLDQKLARALLLNPIESLQAGIDLALTELKAEDRIGVLTHAADTIPYVAQNKQQSD
jgi:nickel-dependent lactate racemase